MGTADPASSCKWLNFRLSCDFAATIRRGYEPKIAFNMVFMEERNFAVIGQINVVNGKKLLLSEL
jgi:hypothetical protein